MIIMEAIEHNNRPIFGGLGGHSGSGFGFVRRHCTNEEGRSKVYGILDLCAQPQEEGF